MGYSDVAAIAANDAIVGGVVRIDFYTANYGALLGSTALAFDPSAISEGLAIATAEPAADIWDASGTVGAVRLLNAADVVVIERADDNAVGLAGSGAFVELSSLEAVMGNVYNLTSTSHSFDKLMGGES